MRRLRPTEPLRCGEQTHPAHASQIDFVTPQFATVYLCGGSGIYIDASGRRHRLCAGAAFHRYPDEPHSWQATTTCHTAFAAIPASAYRTLVELGLPGLDTPVIQPGPQAGLLARLRRLRGELHARRPELAASIGTRLQAWLVDLHLAARPGDPVVERACQLLAEDCSERRPVAEVLAPLGLGYAAVRKRFTRRVGLGPGAFRIRCRLDQACTLLADGALDIASIAEQLGYPDPFAFSKQFRRHLGVSPRRWRQRELGT